MDVHICLNEYSKDTSNLSKLRELTEKLGDTADVRLDINGKHNGQ